MSICDKTCSDLEATNEERGVGILLEVRGSLMVEDTVVEPLVFHDLLDF